MDDKTGHDEALGLVRRVAALLDEKKAGNILVLDISSLTYLTDFFIIADAETQLQIDGLRAQIVDMLSANGAFARNAVNQPQSAWALLDYNGFVVHLFLREAREFYGLEKIWREGKVVTLEYQNRG